MQIMTIVFGTYRCDVARQYGIIYLALVNKGAKIPINIFKFSHSSIGDTRQELCKTCFAQSVNLTLLIGLVFIRKYFCKIIERKRGVYSDNVRRCSPRLIFAAG